MALLDSTIAAALWRTVPVLALVWLAVFFGRTLRTGQTPLIERIARVGIPALSPRLCRYTRTLTAVWCIYFLLAAGLSSTAVLPFGLTGVLVGAGSVLLFVGEHRLRVRRFPDQAFPGLVQQLRDTWHVWRPGT